MNTFTDYPDLEARDRRARFLREARRAERMRSYSPDHWTDLPLLVVVLVLAALAWGCERAAAPVAPPAFACLTPVSGPQTPSEQRLAMIHAVAVGDPSPEASDAHWPWCALFIGDTCSCGGRPLPPPQRKPGPDPADIPGPAAPWFPFSWVPGGNGWQQ